MRYCVFIPALALFLACHKTSNTAPATFSFAVNGTVYQMDGSLTQSKFGAEIVRKIGHQCVATDTIFVLTAFDNASDSFYLGTEPVYSLVVATYLDSLTQIRPTCIDGGGPVTLKNISSVPFKFKTSADYSIITVTSIHDGQADGTFTAHLSSNAANPPPPIIITDGQFKNVPIVNQ
jgi:hypothetical protein